MNEYLVGIIYHYPEDYEIQQKGFNEDYESFTCLFVEASSSDEAIDWAYVVGTKLLNYVNKKTNLKMSDFQHDCRLVSESSNRNFLDFYQRVKVNEMPDVSLMTTEARMQWKKNSA